MESSALARFSWLVHAFSTRVGGSSQSPCQGLNLGFIASDRRPTVEQNRLRFFAALGVESFSFATLNQVHSSHVFRAIARQPHGVDFIPAGGDAPLGLGNTLPAGDALITDQPGILLAVRTADCLPILLVDPHHRAVAALHAGWRGALGRIAEKAVGAMRGVFGSNPYNLHAALGPGIGPCCYEVGEEVVSAFRGRFVNSEDFFKPAPADAQAAALAARYPNLFLSLSAPGHAPRSQPAAHLDLVSVIKHQLVSAGLCTRRIYSPGFCTACRTDLFFSHRKEGPRTGRMMAVVAIRPPAHPHREMIIADG